MTYWWCLECQVDCGSAEGLQHHLFNHTSSWNHTRVDSHFLHQWMSSSSQPSSTVRRQESTEDLSYRWRNYFSYLDRQYFQETYSQVIPTFPEGLIWQINNDPTSTSSTVSNGDFSHINDTLSELDYEADDSLTEGRSLLYESRQPPPPESLFPTSDEDNSDEEQPDWSDWEDVNPTTPAELFKELRLRAHEH